MKRAQGFFLSILMLILGVGATPIQLMAQPHIPTITEWREDSGSRTPVDADGDPIVIGDITGADTGWVRDATEEGTVVFYRMDKDYNIIETKTEEEMQPIIENDPTDKGAGEKFEVSDDNSTGSLSLKAILPVEVQGKDVVVTLYNGTTTGDYHLYAKNDYETVEIVPTGTYRVVNVHIQGDSAQEYTTSYPDDVVVEEGNGASFTFDFQSDVGLKRADTSDYVGDEVTPSHKLRMWQILLISLLGIGVIAAGVIIVISIKRENEF